MDGLKKRQDQVIRALHTLETAIENYKRAERLAANDAGLASVFLTHEELVRTVRDSMIQRFEFCVDSLWKFLKNYLENVEKISLDTKTPRSIFRVLCQTRIISEHEAETAVLMIDSRNQTSHRYKESVAELISGKITNYHQLMVAIIHRIKI